MATSMMSWGALSQSSGLLKSVLFLNAQTVARTQTRLELTRGGRRTCKAPVWQTKRRNRHIRAVTSNLTAENQQFLARVVQDRYAPASTDVTSPLKDEPYQRLPWTLSTMRCGVLAVKIGVVPQWTKEGKRFTTTMLQVLDNHVIRYSPPEEYRNQSGYREKKWGRSNNFGSMVVGAMSCDPLMFTKSYANLFAEAGVPPKRKLTRFLVTPDAALKPGTPLTANHFRVGDYVDCQAKTIGHGFQGVVKRWGFAGGPASHGNTKWHRRPGSIGGGGDKSAVWKGKKMPGHMGMEIRTLKGLRIWRINPRYNVLYVMGQNIPGPNHCYVRIMDSVLRPRRRERLDNQPYMPTYLPEIDGEPTAEEILHEELFDFADPTIVFQEDVAKKK